LDHFDAIEWNNRGIAYHNKRLYEEANDAYDHAIELDPENPIFHKNKEKLLDDIGKKKSTILKSRGVDEPEDGKKTKTEYAIDWNNKGVALSRKGFENEALAAFDRAISLDPTHPIFWKNKAKVLKQTGKTGDANDAIILSEAISTQKNFEDAIEWNNRGYTFSEDGKYEEAVTAFKSALEIIPDFAEAWNNLGYSLAELGRTDDAISACCRSIELNPAFAHPWIEKWFSLRDQACKDEEILSLQDLFEPEAEVTLNDPPHFCNHQSGPIQMERVFIRSAEEKEKYTPYGWICSGCGRYQKD
jgi:tetratricopeptide (TPR) repeat protein